jgi:nitrogen fixation-related uncharacterized protein
MKADTKAALFMAVVILVISAITVIAFLNAVDNEQGMDSQGCPDDTRLCPDGSVVERVLPDCEFRPCPDATE